MTNFKEHFNKVMNEDYDFNSEPIIMRSDVENILDEMVEVYEEEDNGDAIDLVYAIDDIVDELDDSKMDMIYGVLYDVYMEELIDDEIDENLDLDGLSEVAKKVKIKKSDRLKRKRNYKRNKQKIKKSQRLRRKKPKFKKYLKKSKRMKKRGKTSKGARIKKYI